jgi:hypothetical protein
LKVPITRIRRAARVQFWRGGGLPFFSELLAQEVPQSLFGVFSNNEPFFLRPRLGLFLRLRFRFIRHLYNGKLNYSVRGMKVPPAGFEPARLDQSPDCKSGLFANSSTGAQMLREGARGLLGSRLAPTWFGHLSAALNPSSWLLILHTLSKSARRNQYKLWHRCYQTPSDFLRSGDSIISQSVSAPPMLAYRDHSTLIGESVSDVVATDRSVARR